MLSKLNVSSKINNIKDMKKIFIKKINYKYHIKVSQKLNLIGKEVLKKNIKEISKYI